MAISEHEDHHDHERDGDRRAERPIARLQEEVDQRIADEEHLAAAEKLRDQIFAEQENGHQRHARS